MFLLCCSNIPEIWWSLFTSVGMNFLENVPSENWGGWMQWFPRAVHVRRCASHRERACSEPSGMLHQCLWVGAKAPSVAGARPDLGTPRPDGLLDVLWLHEFTMLSGALAPRVDYTPAPRGSCSSPDYRATTVTGKRLPQATHWGFSQLLQTYPPKSCEVLLSGLLHTGHASIGAFMWRYMSYRHIRTHTFVYST